MRFRSYTPAGLAGILLLAVVAGGCGPRTTEPPRRELPPPPPPAAARPTATLTASNTFIQRGESVTLSWTTTDASEATLSPGIGRVEPRGSRQVTPEQSTTYVLTATGPGGSQDASVRITVGAAAEPRTEPPPATIEELFRANVQDAYFDFDKADIRADARAALARTAEFLRSYSQVRVLIEGHCDERGSTEYNLALGDRRAEAARQFLISLGVDPNRIETVSYGKEKPFCTQSNEACWQQNRRAHITFAGTR